MMVGAPEMSDFSSVDLRDRFGVAVVSVDYRLAPEHPHPAGPDDGVAVAEWLLANGEQEFGASRLILGGESAGGYMAAIVLLRIRDELHAADRVHRRQPRVRGLRLGSLAEPARASARLRAWTCSTRSASSSSPSATCPASATTSAATRRSRPRSPTCATCRPR